MGHWGKKWGRKGYSILRLRNNSDFDLLIFFRILNCPPFLHWQLTLLESTGGQAGDLIPPQLSSSGFGWCRVDYKGVYRRGQTIDVQKPLDPQEFTLFRIKGQKPFISLQKKFSKFYGILEHRFLGDTSTRLNYPGGEGKLIIGEELPTGQHSCIFTCFQHPSNSCTKNQLWLYSGSKTPGWKITAFWGGTHSGCTFFAKPKQFQCSSTLPRTS